MKLSALAFAACAPLALVQAPVVSTVEPPSWWRGHTLNPVRLLVRGQNLAGARLESAPGLSLGAPSVNARCTALFVDVTIDPAAAPGPRRLALLTPQGRAVVAFEVREPLAAQGRFAGVGSDDVVYLVMPDRFANGDASNDDPARSKGLFDPAKARFYHGGDLRGVIDRLPYLKELGITALWLNPWYDNVDRVNERERYDGAGITDYHGYGAVDFYAVDEHLGSLDTLQELVEKAHALGIKIVQDQVANHTGPYHPWVQDPPTPTWFNGSADRHRANTWQTWTLADPHATPELQRATLEGWFIDILPDLNQNDPETARYLIQNSLWWVERLGLDAIRQDTLPYAPTAYWREWMRSLKAARPSLTAVGEMFDGDPTLVSFFESGAGLDTVFDFPLYFPLRAAFAEGKPLRPLAQMLARDRLYAHPERLWTFLGLHDVARFMNEAGATPDGLRLAFTFLFTARGTPLVYYGDEIGLPGGNDPDNRRDFPVGAFTDRTPEQAAVWAAVRQLAGLRHELAPLRRGATTHLLVDEQAYAFARVFEGETVVVVLNNDAKQATLDIPLAGSGLAEGSVLVDRLGRASELRAVAGRARVALPPRAAAIYAMRTLSK